MNINIGEIKSERDLINAGFGVEPIQTERDPRQRDISNLFPGVHDAVQQFSPTFHRSIRPLVTWMI